jgi:hypothetical protein
MGWKSYLPGILLRIPIAAAVLWLLLIAVYTCPRFGINCAKQTAASRGPRGSLPSLRDIEYSFSDRAGRKILLKAEGITVRERQYGGVIFTSFKDVVVSNARVFTKVKTTADFFDWADGSDLYLLMGLVLVDSMDKDQDISAIGSRLVIEGLEVYGTDDSKDPMLLVSAERMTRESIGGEIEFSGPLTLESGPARRITCERTAKWLCAQRTMYFPEGCLVNGKSCGTWYWVAGDTLENARQSVIGSNVPRVQYGGLSLPSGERIGPGEILKLIKKKDRGALQELLLQYLVLNPMAFKAGAIFPMIMIGPNFKMGQFTPGPLLSGGTYLP